MKSYRIENLLSLTEQDAKIEEEKEEMSILTKPSLIEYKSLRFLIMDAPKESNLHVYIKECKRQNVRHIVRISEPSYSKEEVENAGIKLHVS